MITRTMGWVQRSNETTHDVGKRWLNLWSSRRPDSPSCRAIGSGVILNERYTVTQVRDQIRPGARPDANGHVSDIAWRSEPGVALHSARMPAVQRRLAGDLTAIGPADRTRASRTVVAYDPQGGGRHGHWTNGYVWLTVRRLPGIR